MVRRIVAIASLVLGFLATTALPTPVAAAPEGKHCVFLLVPVSTDPATETIEATVEEGGCYPTLEDALSAGTGTDVSLSPGTGPEDLTIGMITTADVPTGGDTLIGTEYNQVNFEGSTASWFAPRGCANTTWEVPFVGNDWNDRFASGRGFGTCDHNRKFQHSNFDGSSILCTPNCSTYGSLNNEVSSLRWRD